MGKRIARIRSVKEMKMGGINEVALTLIRGTGYLSREDRGSELQTRKGWRWPRLRHSGVQMLGTHEFEFAVNLSWR